MNEYEENVCKTIFDRRFGSLRHLSGQDDGVNYVSHAVKKDAVELLLESLDYLQESMAAVKNGEPIDNAALQELQQRLQGIVRMKRLLAISEAKSQRKELKR